MKLRARIVFGLIVLGIVGLTGLTHADTIVRGFKANSSLQPGWVVALDKNAANTVIAAPTDDPSRIYGVVIDPSQAPVTVKQSGQQTFVATSGAYPTLVSLSGGVISPGDYLSISTTDGIAGKAGAHQAFILGRSLEKFDGKSGVITTGSDGFAIGRISLSIIPGKNPLVKNEATVPSFLRKIAQGIAGTDKNLTAARIWAALAVFVITLAIAFGVLWIGIRSGMIAIGRNPLSRHSIMQSLLQVITVSVLVLISGLVGVYLLLKL
jgi:hypothetical protein